MILTPFDLLALLGLVPLFWLAVAKRDAASAWWWMAAAFGVSFVADVAGRAGYSGLASQTYPVTQASLFALVLLPRRVALGVISVLIAAASTSIAVRHGAGLDVLLRVIAFGSVAGVAGFVLKSGALRTSLLVYFGAGAIAWLGYVLAPGWTSYAFLQATRVVGIGTFCYAARKA